MSGTTIGDVTFNDTATGSLQKVALTEDIH
jgi:hypothetical protein